MSALKDHIEKVIRENVQSMTSQRQLNRTLHLPNNYEELLHELYDSDSDPVAIVNHFGHMVYYNPAFRTTMMLDKKSSPLTNIYNIDDLPMTCDLRDGHVHITYPNGLVNHHRLTHRLINFQKATLLMFTFKDQTAIFRSDEALKDLKALTNHYMKHLPIPMFLIDNEGIIIHVPSSDPSVFGRAMGAMVGESMFETLPFDYATEIMERMKKITEKVDGHFMYQTENDRIVKVYDTTVHKVAQNRFLCLIQDVSDLNTMSSTIEYLNSYDSLTGFFNTSYYESTLAGMKDSGHLPMGIYVLSLHGLKQVNIRLGYHQCDNLLIEIALKIKSLISQHEIPCRISGDTFIIFFPNCSESTMKRFNESMTSFVDEQKDKFSHYYLTYSEKSILIKDQISDYRTLIKGLMT